MTVFPNFVDTSIAGLTAILGVAYIYSPDWFPFVAEIPALNIANMGAIPAIVYLGYRALNWAKGTSNKAAASSGSEDKK